MSVAPPRPKDLPLTALRAFEAAARLGGFASAGQELGVSPGAVSAHIKTLEAAIGAPLFRRTARGVVLTGLGRRVLPEFTRSFDQLSDAVRLMRAEAAPNIVHIATLPAIAQLWLSRRLPELRAAAPEISVSVTALEDPPYLKRAPYDLCLFFDAGRGRLVAEDWIFPVCAPGLLAAGADPGAIARVPCITDTTWAQDWDAWARAACPGQEIAPHGASYSLYALGLEETVNGAGLMIGHLPLVRHLLDAGRLVQPFAPRVRADKDLRLWGPGATAHSSSAARRVADWLIGSA